MPRLHPPRRRQTNASNRRLFAEQLEPRWLLASDMANVFASFQGDISEPVEQDTVPIHLSPENFTIGGGHATLGFIVKAADGSTLAPAAVDIDSLGPGNVPTILERDGDAGGSSLVLGKLKHGEYNVQVTGLDGTTGGWELHVFLAGDVNGDFLVDKIDHDLLRDAVDGTIPDPDFLAEGDANQDGQLTGYDLARASENKGVATNVRVLTVSAFLDPAFETGAPGEQIATETSVNIVGLTSEGAHVALDEDGDGFDDGNTVASLPVGGTNYVLPANLAEGPNTLRVEAHDDFGQVAQAETVVTLSTGSPIVIDSISPANGEEMVSLTREVIVRFSDQVDPSTITSDSLKVIALGQEVAGRIMVSSTERFVTFFPNSPWNASTEVRVMIDGGLILGRNGMALDADGDGVEGGTRTADFTTLPLTRIPGTNVFGFVRDSFTQEPIVGATIRVDAFPQANAVTDVNGRFELVNMPAPEFFVHVDGSTATNAPAGFVYPNVGKPFHSVPGQTVQLNMQGVPFDIFLPPMSTGDVQPLSPTQPTDVGFGDAGKASLAQMFPNLPASTWDLLKVNFAPGAAVDEFGNPATEAAIIPVPPDRIPAPLPPNLNPQLVISIQAGGATNFDVPAPITFPNLEGLAPGEKSLIFSFNHDAGRWDVIGTGTVSADGLALTSDPGVGILAPGWHFVISGSRNFDLAVPNNGDKDFNTRSAGVLESAQLAALEALWRLEALAGRVLPGFLTPCGSCRFTANHLVHFLDGSGSTITYSEGSTFSNIAKQDSSHQANHIRITNAVKNEIDDRIRSGSTDTDIALILAQQAANVSFGDDRDIFHSVGTTQGVSISGFVDIVNGQYKGELTYTYSDTYGFEVGEGSLRDLQETGFARPFRVEIEIVMPFMATPGVPLPTNALAFQFERVVQASETLASFSTATGFGTDPGVYYRFDLENGLAITGKTNSTGGLNGVVFPPNTRYVGTFYSPSTNRSTTIFGRSTSSGTDFGFEEVPSRLPLENVGGVDSDGDGLPDVGEKAIGTNPTSMDSDGDGITDDAEITQGLDPLDDRGFPTGIISSLPLPGPATDVVVEESTAYVATGGHGLAIIDVSRFNNPILLGQIDLAGTATDVDVDAGLGLAAVTTGTSGVQIIDVSEPMMPEIATVRTNILGSRVEIADGIAYVSVGNSLNAIDLLTGDVLETINLGGGTITDIVQEGSFLYTMDSGRRLRVVDITSGVMVARGSVVLSDGGGKLFVGNGIAYAAAANTSQGGFATADVSNPDAPTVISGTDAPVESAPGTAIVTNGSGIGLLVGQSQRVAGDPSSLQLVNVTDSANTYQLLAEIGLPAPPSAVAVASGIGFIADGTAGLQVVNYLPFDINGQSPSVSISTSVVDLDPATDGIQVLEGTSIPVRADVLDDVQVRNVELLVDGAVVRNDVSFPFDFFALAPSIDGGSGSISLQVRATDTGGNVALSNVLTIELVPDTFPPTIVDINPADGTERPEGHRTVRMLFSEPLAQATINSSTFRIVEAGPSGVFDDGDDVTVPAQLLLRSDDRLVQLTTDPLPIGLYQVRIDQDNVTDRAGNAMGTGVFTSGFEVVEAIPILITFDAGAGTPFSYAESGMTIVSRQDHLHMGDQNGDGSPDLLNHSGCCSTPYQFTFEGGAPFSVVEVPVLRVSGGGSFTSSSGAVVPITGPGTITFDPAGWSNITSFSWDQPSGDAIIDNLLILATPTSSTAAISSIEGDGTLAATTQATSESLAAILLFDTASFTTSLDEHENASTSDPRMDALQQIWQDEAPNATLLIVVGTAMYEVDSDLSREDLIDRLLASPEEIDELFGDPLGDIADVLTLG